MGNHQKLIDMIPNTEVCDVTKMAASTLSDLGVQCFEKEKGQSRFLLSLLTAHSYRAFDALKDLQLLEDVDPKDSPYSGTLLVIDKKNDDVTSRDLNVATALLLNSTLGSYLLQLNQTDKGEDDLSYRRNLLYSMDIIPMLLGNAHRISERFNKIRETLDTELEVIQEFLREDDAIELIALSQGQSNLREMLHNPQKYKGKTEDDTKRIQALLWKVKFRLEEVVDL